MSSPECAPSAQPLQHKHPQPSCYRAGTGHVGIFLNTAKGLAGSPLKRKALALEEKGSKVVLGFRAFLVQKTAAELH